MCENTTGDRHEGIWGQQLQLSWQGYQTGRGAVLILRKPRAQGACEVSECLHLFAASRTRQQVGELQSRWEGSGLGQGDWADRGATRARGIPERTGESLWARALPLQTFSPYHQRRKRLGCLRSHFMRVLAALHVGAEGSARPVAVPAASVYRVYAHTDTRMSGIRTRPPKWPGLQTESSSHIHQPGKEPPGSRGALCWAPELGWRNPQPLELVRAAAIYNIP